MHKYEALYSELVLFCRQPPREQVQLSRLEEVPAESRVNADPDPDADLV